MLQNLNKKPKRWNSWVIKHYDRDLTNKQQTPLVLYFIIRNKKRKVTFLDYLFFLILNFLFSFLLLSLQSYL